MSKIVAGVDASEASRRALRWAVKEAVLRQATLSVVHTWPATYVVPGPHVQSGPHPDAAATERGIADDLVERELDAAGAFAAGLRIERQVLEGKAAEALIEASTDADLLVLGSSRPGLLARAALGEVIVACIHRAGCPVVVVREAEGDGVASET